ncbi:MarR family winged helix-turn-helix transcriptional regulator [Maledivibacter halophilus]|uniref:Transcriptional regulator, MarR family n=1 Tax=Maledivibacter halophilus TaxID=36842 RepID=A0A1T5JRT5_9FIRM|nr:MarR family transcriptional regulator [Maledivibacter halophilus]SKC54162.1 transcriptional regulator, MarR family [Maledivibacter halophilus]
MKNKMDMNNSGYEIILLKFNRLLTKIVAMDKKLTFNVGGFDIRSTDIHLIDTIGRFPNANVTEIAKHLGVTKGAVSQKLTVLEKKGFLRRYKDSTNAKEVIVDLTDLGWEAFRFHENHHQQVDGEIFKFLAASSQENIDFLEELMDIFDHMMNRYLDQIK